jgi:hypothetical protein
MQKKEIYFQDLVIDFFNCTESIHKAEKMVWC